MSGLLGGGGGGIFSKYSSVLVHPECLALESPCQAIICKLLVLCVLLHSIASECQ